MWYHWPSVDDASKLALVRFGCVLPPFGCVLVPFVVPVWSSVVCDCSKVASLVDVLFRLQLTVSWSCFCSVWLLSVVGWSVVVLFVVLMALLWSSVVAFGVQTPTVAIAIVGEAGATIAS